MSKNIKYLLVLFVVLNSNNIFGQLTLGARVGVNYSDLRIANYNSPVIQDITTTSNFGYEAGLFARATILKFYIQPEIIFTQINGGIKMTTITNETKEYDFSLTRLDAPFPIGFKFGMASVFMGPVASFNLNSGASIFDHTYNYGTWSLLAGAGFNLGDFSLEIRYQRALIKHANEAEIIVGEDLYRLQMEMWTSQLIFALGYFF